MSTGTTDLAASSGNRLPESNDSAVKDQVGLVEVDVALSENRVFPIPTDYDHFPLK